MAYFMYANGFLSRGFTDQHEILHDGSVTSRTGLHLFWGDGPRNGDFWALKLPINREYCKNYALLHFV